MKKLIGAIVALWGASLALIVVFGIGGLPIWLLLWWVLG